MIGRFHRFQAYVTWVLYGALALLLILPGGFAASLHRSDAMLVLIVAGAIRLLLPIGTVLAVVAKYRGKASSDSLWRIQFFTFLLSIPMLLVLLLLWVGYTGI